MKRNRWSFLLGAALVLVVFAGVSIGVVNTRVEDFTTTQYKDMLNTTAFWDTVSGVLKLPPFELTLIGGYDTPAMAYRLAVEGDYAFVADVGSGLQVIDISDPTNPSAAGSYDTPGFAYGVAVWGDYAYVADGGFGLQVIDISDPANPSLAGNYNTAGSSYGVAVWGDYAYVADGGFGLQVIDISDPANPSLAGSYDTPGSANAVVISGDQAYVADGGQGLQVIDISDPANPSLAGSYNTPGSANAVVISGDHACMADMGQGLQVIDISDPTNPSLAGSYDTPGDAYGVAISGDYAYVAQSNSGLQVLDISDPTNPAAVDSYDTPGASNDVAVAVDRAYVADGNSGLQVIDIADPVGPSLAASYGYARGPSGVTVAGDRAYVGYGNLGLRVVDISDPTNPVYLGQYNTPGSALHAEISGDVAYVADGWYGLQVIDISVLPPALIGGYDTPGFTYDVAVAGDYAYVADGDSGMQVIDISDPSSPLLAGNYGSLDHPRGITVAGDYAYIAANTQCLEIVYIGDPTNPVLAGTYDTPGFSYDVAVSGNYAYVANYTNGLEVVDISDPSNPLHVGTLDTPGTVRDVAVVGDYVYAADHSGGFKVIDISDPSTPSLVGVFDTGEAQGVDAAGDYAFVADNAGALLVIWVLQRHVDTAANTGQSVQINSSSEDILAVKLSTSQTDTVRWEVSANGGVDWQQLPADASRTVLSIPGNDLRWRSTHLYSAPWVNPACFDLKLDWLYAFAVIEAVTDVPDDQGRQVRVEWTRSGNDFVGASPQIVEYAIYRKHDPDLSSPVDPSDPGRRCDSFVESPGEPDGAPALEGWDYVLSAPAEAEDAYSVVVPTLKDSTITEGMHYTTFLVRARTATPGVHFDSPPDSGYSVDDLEPHVPMGLAAAYNTGSGNQLSWEPSPDEDFQYFRIYRSSDPEFIPAPGNLVDATIDTEWTDPDYDGWNVYYKITAVDFSGNESDPASPGTMSAISEPIVPRQFALYPSVPNPFNPVTVIPYDVPMSGGKVTIQIFNVGGQLVRTLVDRRETVGRKTVSWDGISDRGEYVATGVYFYRMQAPGFEKTMKMTLLK